MPGSTYPLRVPDEIASLVRNLHPHIRSQVKCALRAIIDDPYCGKVLKEELQGLRSYRVKRYRVIYRIVSEKKYLEITVIGPRRNIYEETFKLLTRK